MNTHHQVDEPILMSECQLDSYLAYTGFHNEQPPDGYQPVTYLVQQVPPSLNQGLALPALTVQPLTII